MGDCQENPLQRRKTGTFTMKNSLLFLIRAVLMTIFFLGYMVYIPIFLAFMPPLYIYRFLVIAVQKRLKPNWIGIMSPRDALIGLDNISTQCECMITLLLVLKGEPNLSLIRQVFQNELIEKRNVKGELGYLKLKHYFESWMGFTFWKNEENFSLEWHVREFDVMTDFDGGDLNDKNGDIVTEDELMKSLGPLATKPFPKGISPWEVLIVNKFKRSPPNIHTDFRPTVPHTPINNDSEIDIESAVILRIHHAIADGYSIMKLLMHNISGCSMSVVPKAPIPQISTFKIFLQYIAVVCLTPYCMFLQYIWKIDRTVWHLPSSKLTKQWLYTMTEKIPFAGVKSTSKRMGVCATATLLAGLAGGIHNFLKRKGNARRNTSVMRGMAPMPWKNHPNETLANHWTYGVFEIPVHVSCPRKRLLFAYKNIEGLKRSPILVINFMTVPILLSPPNWLARLLARNWMATMIISNFPGPDFPGFAFYNTQFVEEVVPWVPHIRGNAGMGVVIISYNGGFRVSLSVDKAIIKDQEELNELSQLIAQEFVTLRSLQPNVETDVEKQLI